MRDDDDTFSLVVDAGSWYSSDGEELERQLSSWLQAAASAPRDPRFEGDARVRCVIAPHAGYSYSGPCAAHAYTHLRSAGVSRVFLLGPSHHYYLSGCALSTASVYRTPVGDLEVCSSTYAELRESGAFEDMRMSDDEAVVMMEKKWVRGDFSSANCGHYYEEESV